MSRELDRESCHDLDRSLAAEWILGDGAGGYASSTPLLCPTRRYHGLLVAVPPGTAQRHVFLARFDELLRVGDRQLRFSLVRYGDAAVPRGDLAAVESFALRPHPVTRHRLGAVEVTREIRVARGTPAVLCRYTVRGAAATLELRPWLACRPADALTFANDAADLGARVDEHGIVCRPYAALPPVSITFDRFGFEWHAEPAWDRGIAYTEDLARGYDGHEDQLSPGRLVVDLADGASLVVAATIGAPVADPARVWKTGPEVEPAGDLRARLAASADDYLYRAESGRLGICAGYPWFGEWGRDTCIALPGLTLARGRLELCEEVLRGVLPYLRGGLVPNIFGTGADDSHYGSVDAALWFARAVDLWAEAGGDRALLLDRFLPALREIATRYRDGTDLGVAADDGMLIAAGGPHLNATWMDARTAAGPVTPRDGCAVEINALWYALLDQLEGLEREAGDPRAARRWADARGLAGTSFLARFWLADRGFLADRWLDGVPDPKVRPNMVLAAALARSPLSKLQRRSIVDVATRELLTPRGLRTLAPGDPDYVGHYRGGPEQRDAAYHQGTVWPWLFGFYVEACLRSGAPRVRGRLRALLDGFAPELDRAGLEHVSEVFDGDPPHRPGGAIAQAWSDAELLRAAALLATGRDRG